MIVKRVVTIVKFLFVIRLVQVIIPLCIMLISMKYIVGEIFLPTDVNFEILIFKRGVEFSLYVFLLVLLKTNKVNAKLKNALGTVFLL